MSLEKQNSLHCEIYIDFNGRKEDLQKLIVKLVDGSPRKFGLVNSKICSINIDDNELFNSPKYGVSIPPDDDPKRYLYFKFRVDIIPIDMNVTKKMFEKETKKILVGINKLRIKNHL